MNHSRSKRVQHQTSEQKTLDLSTEIIREHQQKQSMKTNQIQQQLQRVKGTENILHYA